MKVKGIEVEFSFTDIDDVIKLEDGLKKFKTDIARLTMEGFDNRENIIGVYETLKNALINVLGQAVVDEITKGKRDIMVIIEIFEELMKIKAEQETLLANKMSSMANNGLIAPIGGVAPLRGSNIPFANPMLG